MKITLGFSPCPNDTFIFDALIHGKIDTGGLTFDVCFDDVETLNQKAFRGELDVTKLSFHALAYVSNHYALLDAGSALGFGVGPLLIAAQPGIDTDHPDLRVAIPGKYTTANFLLSLAYPHLQRKTELVFSDIEEAVASGEADLGLIIHENRFTYQEKGLHRVADLGEYWETQTQCAIPLGGIVVKRALPDDVKLQINRLIRQSVEYAFAHPGSATPFIREHAQAMSEEVMYRHIDLYVNKYSIDLGIEGRKAVHLLFTTAVSKGIIPAQSDSLFLTPPIPPEI